MHSKRDRVLEILQDAAHRQINYGTPPRNPPQGKPNGWVSGLYLVKERCGTRYGARIHELRHDHGLEITCHTEHIGGDCIPFYRLEMESKTPAPAFTEPKRMNGNLFDHDTATLNSYGRTGI